MYRPGITLAMIVKNDADRLKRCLSSAKGAYDRLVVVDTGSTDGTQLVAKDFSAELVEIEWPGAFDVARNVSLNLVKTEWTLWLDSDEWFSDGSAEIIRQSIKNSEFLFAMMTRLDLDIDGNASELDLLRLWRTHPKLRLIGSVHERFPTELLTNLNGTRPLVKIQAKIWHDGYVGIQDEEKVKRNFELLKADAAARPSDFYVQGKLAEALFVNGNINEGRAIVVELADAIVRDESWTKVPSIMAIVLSLALRTTPEGEETSDRVHSWLKAVANFQAQTPTPVWEYARMCFRRGDLTQAQAALQRLAHFRETGQYDRLCPTNPTIFGKSLDDNLAEVTRLLHQIGAKHES